MSDIVAVHDRALEVTTAIVAKVAPPDFAKSTPCAKFDVAALLNHMIAGNHRFTVITRGEPAISVPATGDFFMDDPLSPYRESAIAVSEAWRAPGVLERTAHLPFGDFPGRFAIGIHVVETIVHGWDLATATAQSTELDRDLVEAAWAHCKDIDESFRGDGRPFGPALEAPPGASDTVKLMAWLGRQA